MTSKRKYRRRRKNYDLGFDINVASELIAFIEKKKLVNTVEIVEHMNKKGYGLTGERLRMMKNQINESILPVIVASDLKGYYICQTNKQLKKYLYLMKTQVKTMEKNMVLAKKKFTSIKKGNFSFKIKI